MTLKARTAQLAALTATLFFMAGCGVTGSWESQSLSPEIARDEFVVVGAKPFGERFTRADITIEQGGTYTADIFYGHKVHHSTGTWEREGEKITFVDHGGATATYEMKLSSDHKELELVRPIEGTDVVLSMKRE